MASAEEANKNDFGLKVQEIEAMVKPELTVLLESSPEIINRILSAGSFRSTLKLERVCRTWHRCSQIIQQNRKDIVTLTACKPMKSSKYQAVCDLPEVSDFLLDLWAPVSVCLAFGKLPLSKTCVGGHDLTGLRSLMSPETVILGFTSSAGIIGTLQDGSVKEFQNPKRECISSILFSQLPGDAKIKTFSLTLGRYEQVVRPDQATLPYLEQLFGLPVDEQIKSLIFVTSGYFPNDIGEKIATAFWRKERGCLAFAGGLAEYVIKVGPGPFTSSVEESGLLGMAITGSNVRAASLILNPDIRSLKRVQEKMSELKQFFDHLPSKPKFSFAIFFTCAGRGKKLFGRENVETSVFREMFPEALVAGIFSRGRVRVEFFGEVAPR